MFNSKEAKPATRHPMYSVWGLCWYDGCCLGFRDDCELLGGHKVLCFPTMRPGHGCHPSLRNAAWWRPLPRSKAEAGGGSMPFLNGFSREGRKLSGAEDMTCRGCGWRQYGQRQLADNCAGEPTCASLFALQLTILCRQLSSGRSRSSPGKNLTDAHSLAQTREEVAACPRLPKQAAGVVCPKCVGTLFSACHLTQHCLSQSTTPDHPEERTWARRAASHSKHSG